MDTIEWFRALSVADLVLAVLVNVYAFWFFAQVRRPLTYYVAVQVLVSTAIAASACYSAFHPNIISYADTSLGPWRIRCFNIIGTLGTAVYLFWIHRRRMPALRDKEGII